MTSGGGYERHVEAVEGAKQVIGELQELMAVATEKAESAMGAVIMAVGDNPNIETSQNIMNFTAHAKHLIEEVYGVCNMAVAELERYAGGF